jgi:hypothetical protein
MEFDEIAYWMAAVMDHGEAMRTASEKAAEGTKHLAGC